MFLKCLLEKGVPFWLIKRARKVCVVFASACAFRMTALSLCGGGGDGDHELGDVLISAPGSASTYF